MDGNNRPQLGMQSASRSGGPRFDFGGIKPKDYNYTGMQAVGDVAGQLLRVGRPFAEATKVNMGIESHERDMASKERIRSLGVATRQLGGIVARANPNNATIFQELNKVSEAEEFIGGQLRVTDTGETRKVDVEGAEKEHPIYTFNVLDPKTGESINEIQATTAEAVDMFDGMLAPEMQRQVRKTAQANTEARKRIRTVGDRIGAGEGNVFDMMAEGIPLTPEMQDTLNTFFAGSPKNQQEIMAQLISDTADENELKKKREAAEETRKVAKEGREREKSVADIALTKTKRKKAQKEIGKPENEKSLSASEKRQRAKDTKTAEDLILNEDNWDSSSLQTEIDFFNEFSDKSYVYQIKPGEKKSRMGIDVLAKDIPAKPEKIDISTPEKIRDSSLSQEQKLKLLKERFGYE